MELSAHRSLPEMRILVVVHGGIGRRVTGPEIRGVGDGPGAGRAPRGDGGRAGPAVAERETGIRLVRSTRGALVREARRHDAVVAPVLPPYLFAALRGTSTVTGLGPVRPDPARALGVRGSARNRPRAALPAGCPRRAAALRGRDRHAPGSGSATLLLEELDAAARAPSAPPTVVNVPFGVTEPPPDRAGRRPASSLPGDRSRGSGRALVGQGLEVVRRGDRDQGFRARGRGGVPTRAW